MNDLATLARLIENLIRLGTIAAVQMAPPRVRVKTGELTTTWLPWLALRAGDDKEWDPAGEQVLLISPSGQLGNGVALTGLFSDSSPTNGDRAGLHRCTYRDGTEIKYDSVSHHLNATLAPGGTTNLVSNGGITIVGPITHQGDYTHQGNYIQSGNQAVTGEVTVSTDVVATGVSLVKQLHIGNLGAPTSPPQ